MLLEHTHAELFSILVTATGRFLHSFIIALGNHLRQVNRHGAAI